MQAQAFLVPELRPVLGESLRVEQKEKQKRHAVLHPEQGENIKNFYFSESIYGDAEMLKDI